MKDFVVLICRSTGFCLSGTAKRVALNEVNSNDVTVQVSTILRGVFMQNA